MASAMRIKRNDDMSDAFYLISINVKHMSLTVQQISSMLNLRPTRSWNAGDPHPFRTGKNAVWPFTAWELRKKVVGKGNFMDGIETLCVKLRGKEDVIKKLNEKYESIRLSIVLPGNVYMADTLETRHIRLLYELGIGLTIDVDPNLVGTLRKLKNMEPGHSE